MFTFLLKAWSGDMVEPLHARQDTESLSAGGKTSGGERDKKMPESLEIPASGRRENRGTMFPDSLFHTGKFGVTCGMFTAPAGLSPSRLDYAQWKAARCT